MRGETIQIPPYAGQLGQPTNAIKIAFHWRTVDGPTLNAGLVTLWFFRGSGPVLVENPIVLWFLRGGGGSRPPVPPLDPPMRKRTVSPESLLLVYWRVRKLSTPSPKDVDCILASNIAYRSSNKTQWSCMYIISQIWGKAQMSLHILSKSRKFYQRGLTLTMFFLFLFFLSWWRERRSKYHHKRANIGPSAKQHLIIGLVTLWFFRGSVPVLLENSKGPGETVRMPQIHLSLHCEQIYDVRTLSIL